MAMNVGGDSGDGEEEVNSTINTTPLVDVMLVLLIIFLITIPVVTQSITLELPKEKNVVTVTKPENILLAVSKDGDVYWNTHQIKDIDELVATLTEKAKIKPQPEVHIRADKDAKFEAVGRVLYAIQRGGIVKVGFLTEPDHGLGRGPG